MTDNPDEIRVPEVTGGEAGRQQDLSPREMPGLVTASDGAAKLLYFSLGGIVISWYADWCSSLLWFRERQGYLNNEAWAFSLTRTTSRPHRPSSRNTRVLYIMLPENWALG